MDYFDNSQTVPQGAFGVPSVPIEGQANQYAFVQQPQPVQDQSYGWQQDTLDAKRSLRNLSQSSGGAYWGIYNSGSGSIPNNTQTTPTWGSGISSAPSSLGTNAFVVPSAGTYCVSGTVRWNGTSGGTRQALLLRNGSFVTAGVQPNNGGANDEYCNLCVVQAFNASDVIRLDVFQNSGTTVSMIAGNCKFSIFKIA